MVGANTVVLSEVEEGSTIVGVQGRIAKKTVVKNYPCL